MSQLYAIRSVVIEKRGRVDLPIRRESRSPAGKVLCFAIFLLDGFSASLAEVREVYKPDGLGAEEVFGGFGLRDEARGRVGS